jgi:hypothetical protein
VGRQKKKADYTGKQVSFQHIGAKKPSTKSNSKQRDEQFRGKMFLAVKLNRQKINNN